MQSPSPAVARCALPWVTRPEQSPNPVRVSTPRLPDPAPSHATMSTSLGLGGRRRQMLQPLSGLAGFLGALPGVGPPPTAPAVQPRANCCNPFGIGGAAGPSRREEIGEGRGKIEDRREKIGDRRGAEGTTDCRQRFHPCSSGFICGLIPSGHSFNAAFRFILKGCNHPAQRLRAARYPG